MNIQSETKWIKVWDPIIRIKHWLIVSGFFIAYLVEDDNLALHTWAGYVVGGVILLRLIWGFAGPSRARFKDFIYSPSIIISYFKNLLSGNTRRYMGHSPAGGAMIIALLLGLFVITSSGLTLYAYEENTGPLRSLVDNTVPHSAEFEAREEFWEEVHEVTSNLVLFLVMLHVLGVVVASRVHKENLVKSMLTGKKRSNPGSHANDETN